MTQIPVSATVAFCCAAFLAGMDLQYVLFPPDSLLTKIQKIQMHEDPTRAALLYANDKDGVVYYVPVPDGTVFEVITIKGAQAIGSVHAEPMMGPRQ